MPPPNVNDGRNGYGYLINIMMLFAMVGMCIKIFFGNITSPDGTIGRASSTIWGYGAAALAILTVMFISYAIHDKIRGIKKDNNLISFLKSFLTSSMPAILTIITFFWIISLNISYFTRINKGEVAVEYYQLSAGTSFLFAFQILCLFQYLKEYIKDVTKQGDKDSVDTMNRLAFATYFIAALNLIVVGMMTIILEFFSTDG